MSSAIEWVSRCPFFYGSLKASWWSESLKMSLLSFLFYLEILPLQCFSLRITVYSVFPRSMSLSQENEWPSLSEKSKIDTILNAQESALCSFQVCVCVCFPHICHSVSELQWVSQSLLFFFMVPIMMVFVQKMIKMVLKLLLLPLKKNISTNVDNF